MMWNDGDDMKQHLAIINSATKYPSIPTFHALGDRGRLLDEVQVAFDGSVSITEKIDGTNTRIVVIARGRAAPMYLIGSREELLTASEDLVHNPAMGIVDGVRQHAERARQLPMDGAGMLVIWGEFYGGRVTAASKQYTSKQATSFAVFDVARFSQPEVERLLGEESRTIAAWRDAGGQPFVDEQEAVAKAIGARTVPSIAGDAPPKGVEQVHGWLQEHLRGGTRAALDDVAGRPEGVVVRDQKRRIAKLRIEDYERTRKAAR